MMSFRALRLPFLALSLASLPVLLPMGAHAQMSMGAGGLGGGPSGPGGGSAADDDAKAAALANAPPPALPGAVSTDPAAPSSHAATDMDPTAALFDAIDRGDLTAAKDALARGADLSGSNVLGEKPIEMSIDLNRNDITFLLLSMRNNDADTGTQVASASTSAHSDRPGHLAIDARSARKHEPVEQASYTRRVPDNGGVANPQIGFLGFNGS